MLFIKSPKMNQRMGWLLSGCCLVFFAIQTSESLLLQITGGANAVGALCLYDGVDNGAFHA